MERIFFQSQGVLRIGRVHENGLAAQIRKRFDLRLRHQLGRCGVRGGDENDIDTRVLNHSDGIVDAVISQVQFAGREPAPNFFGTAGSRARNLDLQTIFGEDAVPLGHGRGKTAAAELELREV